MKVACFWRGSALVNPSAGISAVGTHWICRTPLAISCRNQWLWMSIYFSLVLICGESAVRKRIVCRLSHKTAISCSGSSCIALKNLFHYITSLAAWERANSSASVLDVVTVFCLVERQSIGPLNSLNRYPSVLYLVIGSSANAASPAQATAVWSFDAEYSIARARVPYRYEMARSTASWWRAEGFRRNSDSLLAALAASGLVIVVA